VLRRVRLRRGVAWLHAWLGDGMGALRAELSGGGEPRAAVRAWTNQRPAALFAEPGLRAVLVLAQGDTAYGSLSRVPRRAPFGVGPTTAPPSGSSSHFPHIPFVLSSSNSSSVT